MLQSDSEDGEENGGGEGGLDLEEDEEEPLEFISIADSYVTYLAPFIRLLALTHTFLSFGMIVAYYCLKVRKLI